MQEKNSGWKLECWTKIVILKLILDGVDGYGWAQLVFIGGAIKKKMSQIVEKVHNFLDPPTPQDNLDYFEFGKKLKNLDPSPQSKLVYIWNVG